MNNLSLEEKLYAQLPYCLKGTDFNALGERYEGKVRDNYSRGKTRFLITTDRISAFDKVITLIPFKGDVLCSAAKFWFENTKDIIPNHLVSSPDPCVTEAKLCKALPVEMVVRGYLTGVTSTSAWYHYERGVRNFCGNLLPEGMRKNDKFESPIITPSTKAEKGDHDESVSREEILARGVVTPEQFDFMADVSMKLYLRGVEIAKKNGVILVDTKYEFGVDEDGNIILIDEIHTPDSSRFWLKDKYEEFLLTGNESDMKMDKEFFREWLKSVNYSGDGEPPVVPDEIRVKTGMLYIKACELLTGQKFTFEVGDTYTRIKNNLALYF